MLALYRGSACCRLGLAERLPRRLLVLVALDLVRAARGPGPAVCDANLGIYV
jgi:hypothetical protein